MPPKNPSWQSSRGNVINGTRRLFSPSVLYGSPAGSAGTLTSDPRLQNSLNESASVSQPVLVIIVWSAFELTVFVWCQWRDVCPRRFQSSPSLTMCSLILFRLAFVRVQALSSRLVTAFSVFNKDKDLDQRASAPGTVVL